MYPWLRKLNIRSYEDDILIQKTAEHFSSPIIADVLVSSKILNGSINGVQMTNINSKKLKETSFCVVEERNNQEN
uniref:Uncharacterized protein n=1 Tax=Strigamia maritima TaxID=126957 RepID=T1ISU0_STRMM